MWKTVIILLGFFISALNLKNAIIRLKNLTLQAFLSSFQLTFLVSLPQAVEDYQQALLNCQVSPILQWITEKEYHYIIEQFHTSNKKGNLILVEK